MEFVIEIQPRN